MTVHAVAFPRHPVCQLPSRRVSLLMAMLIGLGSVLPTAMAQVVFSGGAAIDPSRGVDDRVDYPSLTRFGPWDDRNYMLRLEDVQLLPEDDQFLHNVPAFWRIDYRKRTPEMVGWNMYPKSIDQEFQMRFGGLMQNGVVKLDGLGLVHGPTGSKQRYSDATRSAPVLQNIVLDAGSNRNECTVEYNPVNQNQVIAGCNGTGQEQYFSSNGGETWTVSGNLPSTCCDPALDWSVDGTVAYAATLGNSGGLRATVFRSTNAGQTWGGRIDVSTGSSDKEWIHVDRSPTSPFSDRVYLTWHQGNVMFFSSSSDRSLTWTTPVSFPSAPRGIGSDIATAPDGTIYYVYASLQNASLGACAPATPCVIRLLKSTDGGATFVNPAGTTIANMRGRFEAAVPSMETRRTFFYAAVDVDHSNGPRRGRVYVSWTDLSPRTPANNSVSAPASNNVLIRVVYSDDGGSTWTEMPAPHEIETTTQDSCVPAAGVSPCIDRYHQWIDVDPNGVVHIGYYDTRQDLPGRNRVDFYYTYSTNGTSWVLPATRVSTASSNNIANGQEWGDYNGLSVSLVKNRVLTVWTDNRPVQNQKAVAGEVVNVTSYEVVPPATPIGACAGQTAGPIPLLVRQAGGLTDPVTLATVTPPAAFGAATFTPNPVVPSVAGTTANLSVPITPATPAGNQILAIRGTASGGIQIDRSLTFNVFAGSVGPLTLTTPASAAPTVPVNTGYVWAAATNAQRYRFELSRFSDFSILLDGRFVEGTSFTPVSQLSPGVRYYWRVRPVNPCGDGAFVTRDFVTAPGVAEVLFSDGFAD